VTRLLLEVTYQLSLQLVAAMVDKITEQQVVLVADQQTGGQVVMV
jgi:hypothetical protein